MIPIEELSNYQHPLVQKTVSEIVQNETIILKKLEKIFYYVRDEIKFGFPKNGDFDKASDVIRQKMGQCNTKGTLFLAFCKVIGLEAQIHYSTIKKEIQWGLFKGITYKLLPDLLSHSWIEVKIDGQWKKIDAYINDIKYFKEAKKELKKQGLTAGYSVSCPDNDCPSEFDLDDDRFQQMGSIVEDQGTWDDTLYYLQSGLYRNDPSFIKKIVYRLIVHKRVNKKIDRMRLSAFRKPSSKYNGHLKSPKKNF